MMLQRFSLTRRNLIGQIGGATLAAGSSLGATGVRAKGDGSSVGKIDVHFHMNLRAPGPPIDNSRFGQSTPELALEDMDKGGVAVGICSPGGGIGGSDVGPEQIRRSRDWNERTARLCADHPTRFGHFAALPLPDIEGALREIEHASDHYALDGFALVTNYGDMWLGDLRMKPVYEELNRRHAVVYVHPTNAPCCNQQGISLPQAVSDTWIEWPMNTARAMLSVMVNGILRTYPNIRFIFSHSGGVMPLLVARISGFADWDWVGPEKLRELFPDGVEEEFAKCFFEIGQGFAPANFHALATYARPSRILFGSDYPFFSTAHSSNGLAALQLEPALEQAIERHNALALFPRWGA